MKDIETKRQRDTSDRLLQSDSYRETDLETDRQTETDREPETESDIPTDRKPNEKKENVQASD